MNNKSLHCVNWNKPGQHLIQIASLQGSEACRTKSVMVMGTCSVFKLIIWQMQKHSEDCEIHLTHDSGAWVFQTFIKFNDCLRILYPVFYNVYQSLCLFSEKTRWDKIYFIILQRKFVLGSKLLHHTTLMTSVLQCRCVRRFFWSSFGLFKETIFVTHTNLSPLSVNSFTQGQDWMLTCICTLYYIPLDQKLMEQKCPWKLKDASEIAKINLAKLE